MPPSPLNLHYSNANYTIELMQAHDPLSPALTPSRLVLALLLAWSRQGRPAHEKAHAVANTFKAFSGIGWEVFATSYPILGASGVRYVTD